MNTKKKGDKFEEASYDLIKRGIESGELGLHASYCKVFQKKGYHSKELEKDIEFDLTIEIWPPNAERYSMLWVIECKGYETAKVPVKIVNELKSKIDQISPLNTKGVIISKKGFQEGAYKLAKSWGCMLIQLDLDGESKVLLSKIHRSDQHSNEDAILESMLIQIFNKNAKIVGLKKLTSEKIEDISKKLIQEFQPEILENSRRLPCDSLAKYLQNKYQLGFDFNQQLGLNSNGEEILGLYSQDENKVYVDRSIVDTSRFPFVFAHEVGHFFLHRNLQINQMVYDSFRDPEYNFRQGRYSLKNEKNFIEWQANQFASTLILPSISLQHRLMWFQYQKGIPHRGRIYVDSQPINISDYYDTVLTLSKFFGVTMTSVIIRLQQLEILHFDNSFKQIGNIGVFNYLD